MQYGKVSLSQQWNDWVQPLLSSNGILGGNSFAVGSSTTGSGTEAYKAFDNRSTSNYFSSSAGQNNLYLTFYNPTPLKVIKITHCNSGTSKSSSCNGYTPATGDIYACNDGSSWSKITSFTNSSTSKGAQWDINVNASTAYKYWRINPTTCKAGTTAYDSYWQCDDIYITAKYSTQALNSITFPTSFTNTYYGFSLCYFGGIENDVYLNSKTTSSVYLNGVNGNASSAYYIANGY